MAKASRDVPELPATIAPKAFLVVRRGGRWTDLLRLSPDRTAVIGRASSNQIVVRSHQASRQHAEIRWDDGQWWIRDLTSRNGTIVDGHHIAQAQPLHEGNCIEVAGCAMMFVTNVADALASSDSPSLLGRASLNAASQLTDDQMTMDGLVSESITHRSSRSRFLDLSSTSMPNENSPSSDAWQLLFGLAYQLASVESIEEASQITLSLVCEAIRGSAGGVFLPSSSALVKQNSTAPQMTLIAFVVNDNRSYRPSAASIVQSAITNRCAVVARNIIDDQDLQAADSRGEYSTTTAIIAPIFFKRANDSTQDQHGYLHLYSTDSNANFSATELDLAIAAAGVLAAAIDNLQTRKQLASSLRNSRRQIERLRQRLEDSVRIIGNSDAIQQVKSMIARVARTNTTVLIRGESGVGKELVATAIHHASPRRDGPLICLNCAALSPTLLESELFGHEKGAFTGATEQKKGKFESADGGSLMLDEIGEMHIDLQAKLLRVLEGHPFERLGGQQAIKVDVRLIAATNRDLPQEVQLGRFRSDLYYRLNVVEIVVPPLRERRADIMPIANHYLHYFSDKTARRVDGFTRRAGDAMIAHAWPGNIRELKNVIERAVVLGCDDTIDAADLNIAPIKELSDEVTPVADPSETGSTSKVPTLDEVEQKHLLAVLREVGGNKSRAAVLLGIERSTLDRKLKRLGIQSRSLHDQTPLG